MSKCFILFLICEPLLSCSHNLNPFVVDNGMPAMVAETGSIMQALKIPIRHPIQDHQDSIQFATNKGLAGLNAFFSFKATLYINNNGHIDSSNRSYEDPIMIVSNELIDILNRRTDTSKSAYSQAKAVVIHELTHYLQATIGGKNYVNASIPNFTNYLIQPIEFEAYAVESYYYLKYTDGRELRRIMRKKISSSQKMKELINSVNNKIFDGKFPKSY
jgi:hypothetical protein